MRRQPVVWATGRAALAAALLAWGAGSARAQSDDQEPWLGVYTQTLTPELREGLGYDGSGALVSRVIDDSPADQAGVRTGDVIVGISTSTVASASDLSRAVRAARVGQTVSVRIIRNGHRRTLTAKLAARPAEDEGFERREAPEPPESSEPPEASETPEPPVPPRFKDGGDFDSSFEDLGPGMKMLGLGRGRLGVRIESLNPDLGSYFGVRDGKGALVVEVMKDTPAERAGLKAGDVITLAGDRRVDDADDLVKALRAEESKVTLTVVRKGATRTIESELNQGPRIMRFRRDGPLGFRDGDVRIRRSPRDGDADLRRELEELRRELHELREKLEERDRN